LRLLLNVITLLLCGTFPFGDQSGVVKESSGFLNGVPDQEEDQRENEICPNAVRVSVPVAPAANSTLTGPDDLSATGSHEFEEEEEARKENT